MSNRLKLALDALNAGQLALAIGEVQSGLRDAPGSVDLRWLYCQLLCLKQDWAKARSALEQVRTLAGAQPVLQQVFLLSRLIDGEQKRNQVWEAGRTPEFMDEIGNPERLSLQAWTHWRAGEADRYRSLIEERAAALEPTPVVWHGNNFSSISDLDEPTAPFLEVISTNGDYFWLPWRQLVNLAAEPPRRPLDFIWTPVRIKLVSGGELFMYANVLYPSRGESEERFLLGLDTEWGGEESVGQLGRGKKIFLLGDEQELTVHEFESLEFASSN